MDLKERMVKYIGFGRGKVRENDVSMYIFKKELF